MDALLAEVSGRSDIKVLILTGEGKAFVAGADISEMADKTKTAARKFSAAGQKTLRALELLDKVVIAAVNGFALGGGCELALACDIRFAAESARFGQPEIDLGITPGFGGTQRLPRALGMGWAKYLCLSGRSIRADEALRIGLVQAVFPCKSLMDEAMKLAGELAAKSPLAMRYCKSALHYSRDVDIDTGQEIERDLFSLCFASEDQTEGMAAFLEKRKPEFKGR
jgi:enoyl-CoA hydratase